MRKMRSIFLFSAALLLLFQNCGFGPGFGVREDFASFSSEYTPVGKAPPLRLLSTEEYLNSVSDLVGTEVDRSLVREWNPSTPAHGFDTLSALAFDEKTVRDRLKAAEQIAKLALESPTVMTCFNTNGADSAWASCASEIALEFAERAYRRPLRAGESDALRQIYETVAKAAVTRQTRNPSGYLDDANSSLIVRGWALDQDWPERVVEVHFYVDGPAGTGKYAGNTMADRPRPDVNTAFEVPGNHGFEFRLPTTYADGQLHTVYAHAIGGGNPLLLQSGKLFRSTAAGAAPAAKHVSTPMREGLHAVFTAVLVSPQFLVKDESPENPGALTGYELDQYQIASRLSYLIAGTLPDRELLDLAHAGKLTNGDIRKEQAERLLAKYSYRLAMNFAGQWLGFRAYAQKYSYATPANATESLESLMAEESALVFQKILDDRLPFEAVLEPGFTFVNSDLARHYGLSNPGSPKMTMVNQTDRGGALMQGSVLRLTSNVNSTHPIRRGRWVLGTLLCQTIPNPDGSLRDAIEDAQKNIPPNTPIHERLEIHRKAGSSCQGCHVLMDPIGLGLENYNEFGQWRTTYTGINQPVVAKGVLGGRPFSNGRELSRLIKVRTDYRECVTRKLASYVLSRGLDSSEEHLVRDIARTSPSLTHVILDLVGSRAFIWMNGVEP